MANPVRATTTLEEFSVGFERCFRRVYAYVGRRVKSREVCERIVGEVLAENVDLLVERGDDRQQAGRLKASSDRLIEAHENPRRHRGASNMESGKTEELKGRVEEAAGVLTDDEKLKQEGRADQAVGRIKQAVDKLIDKAKKAIR
jgi:uncharacterized protein YjbJ (UPF0337 family)